MGEVKRQRRQAAPDAAVDFRDQRSVLRPEDSPARLRHADAAIHVDGEVQRLEAGFRTGGDSAGVLARLNGPVREDHPAALPPEITHPPSLPFVPAACTVHVAVRVWTCARSPSIVDGCLVVRPGSRTVGRLGALPAESSWL